MKRAALTALVLAAVAVPAICSAHSLGYSLEYDAPEAFFDIGYSDPLMEATPIRFDLGIYVEKDGDPIPFTGTWVRISQGAKTVFAGPIGKALFGSPGFTYAFPSDGEYEISIRFEDDDGSIAQHAFAVTVAKDERKGGGSQVALAAAVSAALGLAAGFAAARLLKGR